jgi:hypothetical protein
VREIVWSNWGSATAAGQGVLSVNTCTPNCVQGHFESEPATVTLSSLTQSSTGPSYGYLTVVPTPPNSGHLLTVNRSLPG